MPYLYFFLGHHKRFKFRSPEKPQAYKGERPLFKPRRFYFSVSGLQDSDADFESGIRLTDPTESGSNPDQK